LQWKKEEDYNGADDIVKDTCYNIR
jgi:hypothetical protein